jgi:DNA processing protein
MDDRQQPIDKPNGLLNELPLELTAWLRLLLTEGVGNTAAQKLLAAFGLPSSIFQQSLASLSQVVSERQAAALHSTPDSLEKQIRLCQQWLASDLQRRKIVTLDHPLYPQALLTMPDPPLVLWLMGQIDCIDSQGWPAGISLVGSRNPSNSGEKIAHAFAKHFVQSGLCVVSGLALGIDAASHAGALAGQKSGGHDLVTIAVVGTGLDRVYPKQNLELAHLITHAGLIVSEFPLGSAPLAANFPKRNRLIAALGLGTLVVEAALQSGSLITARESLDLGKDVFAIPGSIHSAQSKGCHALIKQGAKLVESADDVLDELRVSRTYETSNTAVLSVSTSMPLAGSSIHHPILKALGFDPLSFDALQSRLGIDAAALQVQMLELELDNLIVRLPGGLYQVRL